MFIEARDRLINLYLLQNIKYDEIDGKYYVSFVFSNGATYDEEYNSQEAAEEALEDYKTEILSK